MTFFFHTTQKKIFWRVLETEWHWQFFCMDTKPQRYFSNEERVKYRFWSYYSIKSFTSAPTRGHTLILCSSISGCNTCHTHILTPLRIQKHVTQPRVLRLEPEPCQNDCLFATVADQWHRTVRRQLPDVWSYMAESRGQR